MVVVNATTMKEKILEEIGLSKNEVTTYLKLIELGPSTAVEVAKGTRLHRPNVYDALNKLVKRSLVGYFLKEKVKYYEVLDPEQLMTLMKAKELELQKIMPELKVLQLTAKPSTNVAVFEGIMGARRMMTDMINNTKNLYVLGVPKDYAPTLGEGWVKQWHETRVKKKVTFHHIVNEDYYPRRIKFLKSLKHTSIKFLPKKYNSPNVLWIYDKGIVLNFMQPFVCVRILSQDAAKSFKQYYKMLESMALKKAPQEE
jgi:sugar-specific transcriptional regulator TrmB